MGPTAASEGAVERPPRGHRGEEAAHGLRAHAVAPGVVDTDMQAAIRATPPDRMPDVDRFVQLKADDAFNSPAHVARWIARLAFDPAAATDACSLRVPDEG